ILLNSLKKDYIVCVTTNYGADLASKCAENIVIKRMDRDYMTKFMKDNKISLVIDSTHPYAIEVSKNAIEVSDFLGIKYLRYERKSLLDNLNYEKVVEVKSVEEAYQKANELGSNIFLGTGSKTIGEFVKNLKNKNIVARVSPTSDV
ncbi:precorrin-6A/cobalt-precorrin-6A reductase, partial [Clostridium sp. ATCC 25772]|uniref:precorrin-6A/cobalt-precorrin-6A reductase n=1 Tax=Clostridium sp. ATCC 25772 TaxID=1676991 RepID=UPI000ADBBBB2